MKNIKCLSLLCLRINQEQNELRHLDKNGLYGEAIEKLLTDRIEYKFTVINDLQSGNLESSKIFLEAEKDQYIDSIEEYKSEPETLSILNRGLEFVYECIDELE